MMLCTPRLVCELEMSYLHSAHTTYETSLDEIKELLIKLAIRIERLEEEVARLKSRLHGEETKREEASDIDPEALAEFLSVLSSPERILILKLLSERDRYFSELEEELGLGPSSLRHHLSKLMSSGLVVQERARGKYKISERGRVVFRVLVDLYSRVVKR